MEPQTVKTEDSVTEVTKLKAGILSQSQFCHNLILPECLYDLSKRFLYFTVTSFHYAAADEGAIPQSSSRGRYYT